MTTHLCGNTPDHGFWLDHDGQRVVVSFANIPRLKPDCYRAICRAILHKLPVELTGEQLDSLLTVAALPEPEPVVLRRADPLQFAKRHQRRRR